MRTLNIELERIRIITRKSQKTTRFCEFCQTESEFVSEQEAQEIANIIGSGRSQFHFYQPNKNETFVCLSSIFENSK